MPKILRVAVAKWWPLLAVLLVLATIVGVGGLEQRTDMMVDAQPGEELNSHDLMFTFSEATVQRVTGGYSANEWRVAAKGTVRNPNDESLAPITGDYGHFGFKDEASGQISIADSTLLGGDLNRSLVVPGAPAIEIAVMTKFDSGYQPQREVLMSVCQMEHSDNTVLGLGGGQARWNIDSTKPCYLLHLPLTRLPDAES